MRETFAAPIAIVAGMMVLALSDNFIGLVADRMSLWQYHALRSTLLLPLMAGVMLALGQARTLRPQRPGAVALRAAFTVFALMSYFAAIPAVSISLAAAGLFTSPIWVTVFAITLFGERVGPRRIAALALGFAGVCLVLRIGTEPLRVMAVVPILGGAAYALNVIWTRRYCRQESAGALAFWNMGLFLCTGLAGMALTPWLAVAVGHIEGTGFATMPVQPLDRDGVLIVFALGVGGAIGMVCLALGYRGADSTFAALFDFSFLFWVPLFAWLLWGETLSAGVGIGMVLIVLAGWLAVSGMDRSATAAGPS